MEMLVECYGLFGIVRSTFYFVHTLDSLKENLLRDCETYKRIIVHSDYNCEYEVLGESDIDPTVKALSYEYANVT